MEKPASGVTAAMVDRAASVLKPPQKICGTAWVAVTLTALHGWAAGGVSGAHVAGTDQAPLSHRPGVTVRPAFEALSVSTWGSLPLR